jgi:quercetin dioxygenase-like cupin family protein
MSALPYKVNEIFVALFVALYATNRVRQFATLWLQRPIQVSETIITGKTRLGGTMKTKTTLSPIIVQPGAGKDLSAFGDIMTVMLGAEQTGNLLSVLFDVTPPGGGPPLHVHRREDEIFLVVEGRISYCVNGEWTEVPPGGVVYLPREVPHCYRNVGETPSRQWVITTPSGFEVFFSRCAEEFAKAGGPDMGRIAEISHEHGMTALEGG